MTWNLRELESVGWGTFGIVSVVLMGPGIYLGFAITYDTTEIGVRIALGVFLALVIAAFLTWGANELLYQRAKRPSAKRNRTRKRRACRARPYSANTARQKRSELLHTRPGCRRRDEP